MTTKRQGLRLAATALAAVVAAVAVVPSPAQGDPPPWAPAHGHRAKHKHKHEHDDYALYKVPYGIDRGYCDRGLVSSEVIGGVLGGAVGGVAGSQVGKGTGKTAATIGGAIVGVLVGAAIGRSMDDVDQNCVGRALEYAPDRQRIKWTNDAGYEYGLVPLRTFQNNGLYCREYQAVATVGGKPQQVYGTACRQPDGAWKIVS
jgi:surface antigen